MLRTPEEKREVLADIFSRLEVENGTDRSALLAAAYAAADAVLAMPGPDYSVLPKGLAIELRARDQISFGLKVRNEYLQAR